MSNPSRNEMSFKIIFIVIRAIFPPRNHFLNDMTQQTKEGVAIIRHHSCARADWKVRRQELCNVLNY